MALSTYTYEQLGFGTELGPLTGKEKDALEKSWAVAFASDIFPYIDEKIFAPLYSERKSRRNVPVNVLAGAMLLQEIRGMSDEDLVEAAMFDLRLRTALHITNAVGQPLSLRTIQRFRTRLKRYRESSGQDLLGICFDGIGSRLEPFLQKYAKYMVNAARTAEENRNRRMAKDRQGAEEKGQTVPGEVSDQAKTKQAEPHEGTKQAETKQAELYEGTKQAEANQFDLAIIADPDRVRENCLPAHSDHLFFADESELVRGACQPAGTAGDSVFRFSLNGLWKFSWAAKPAEAAPGFEVPGYDCHLWADIRVPSNIEMEGYGIMPDPAYQELAGTRENFIPGREFFDFNPTASYVKYFRLPPSMKRFVEDGSPLIISFRGVESGFALWCNGHYAGYSEDASAPSEFDLTPYLTEGENKLAVRVFGRTSSSRQDSRDVYRFSGIFRDVYLYTIPAAHLYDLRIRPELDEDLEAGRLEIEAHVRILKTDTDPEKSRKQRLRLYYALTRGEEQILEGAAAVTGTDSSDSYDSYDSSAFSKVVISEQLASPALWSAEDPQLYDLTFRLVCEKSEGIEETEKTGSTEEIKELGEKEKEEKAEKTEDKTPDESEQVLLEIVCERVCFRRFDKKDGRVYLNGKQIIIRGVDYREFSCDSGHAVAADTVYQDLLLMKKININAVRTGHYPHLPALSRFCDELGLYLISGDSPKSSADPTPAETSREVNCGDFPALSDIAGQGEFIPEFIEPSIRLKNRRGEDFLAYGYGRSVGEYTAEDGCDGCDSVLDNDPDGGISGGIIDGMRRPYAGRMQEIAYHYQSMRLQVGRDRVLIRNDNLFTATDRYDCIVCLDREGKRIAEAMMNTAVPPLSEEEYCLPQSILKKIEQIESEKILHPVEYAVTVSMRLCEDCAWAEKGHETAFGQGVFLTETDSVSNIGNEAVPDKATDSFSFNETEKIQPIPSEGAVEITDIDSLWQFSVQTSWGWLDFNSVPGYMGIRGDSFEALFSLARGGIVSFRHGDSLYPAGSVSGGRIPGGRSAFAFGELFEKMPRPCFWRVPSGHGAGIRQAARCGIWKLADEYLIPRRDTLRIFAEDGSIFLHLEYQLPFSGGSVAAGYRFYGDGRLTMSLEWVPDMTISDQKDSGDVQAGLFPAIPPLPVFGFSFRLNPELDRFTYYGIGPAENYACCSRGSKLGIYDCTVAENMTHHSVPQECGSRSGVRWACVTDRLGRGIRFTAGNKEGISLRPGNCGSDASSDAQGRPAMEFCALPYSHQEIEAASHFCELPPVHYTNVRCALTRADFNCCGKSTEDGDVPPHFLPADRKLYFEVTIEGI